MKNFGSNRRTFLKTGGLVGGALLAGAGSGVTSAGAQTTAAATAGGLKVIPKGLTLCTLQRAGGGFGLGVRTDKGILDVVAAEAAFKLGVPTTITALFAGQGDPAGLKGLVDKAATVNAMHFVAADKAKFGPCVTDPEKIICVGLNYRKHAAETNNPVPKTPILFNKFNTALNSHGGEIAVSKEKAVKFDYEAELVIVIGKTARDVTEVDALNYVFGYCTGNDFTARDLQSTTSQWMLGKSLDGSGPIGPWLVTADQVDGDNLKIEGFVNGELRQSSSTSDMVFNCKQLVSYASNHMTLKPGDIIFTGTPSGVIAGYAKDKQVWLKPGDKLVTSIEKLGDLAFTLT
jgi:2-keto-4-pentenoate hydratase/2-oxohepta-3-ene-1,7-dioic acid hydratase in catechol pathway